MITGGSTVTDGTTSYRQLPFEREAAEPERRKTSDGAVVRFLLPKSSGHEGFLRSKKNERRKFLWKTQSNITTSRSTGTPSKSPRKSIVTSTDQSGEHSTMRVKTASAAVPRISFGSATVSVPAVDTTPQVGRSRFIRPSAKTIQTSLSRMCSPLTSRCLNRSLWIRPCSPLYTRNSIILTRTADGSANSSCRARPNGKWPPIWGGANLP